ncbi:MAG: shikimate dehydrogenase [Phycisphaeraceae bacterium]
MTKLTVAIFVHSLEQALAAAAQAAERGADLVEYRIDDFTSDHAALTQIIEQSPLPSIVTCRVSWEGGNYRGTDAERLAAYQAACAGARKPAYLDVELVAYQKSHELRAGIDALVDHPAQLTTTDTGLILSNHDFDGRPLDLFQRIEVMLASNACRVMKIAWRARSLRDNLEAFALINQRHKPTIALCMGDEGLASRVLSKKFNALLTFVALNPQSATAPGQPTVEAMKMLYRWDAINPETRVYGVIGWPVAHSMSPAFHNAGFDAADYNGVYLPMPVPPEYEHFKATVLSWLDFEDLHFRGASVTIPHKQNLLRFVKERGGSVEPLAEKIGAANTLTVSDDGSLHASNTDYAAALDSVCDAMGITREELAGKRVAVLGAGGAARAIVAGFAHCGATIVIYNRTFEKAEALAKEFNDSPTAQGISPGKAKVVAARVEKLCDSCCEIYINCTSVGMHPNVDASPLPAESANWQPGTVVFDTVYNPLETKLLREAKAAGCLIVSGSEMFIRQGAAQFKMWTGQEPPMDLLSQVVVEWLTG